MRSILIVTLAMGLFACSSGTAPAPNPLPAIGCSAETAITSGVAASIATALNCTNLSAIQGDIMAALGKANLCAKAAPQPASAQAANAKNLKGILGDIVCPTAVDAVLGLVTSKIPVIWACDPSAKVGDVKAMIEAACSKAIGI